MTSSISVMIISASIRGPSLRLGHVCYARPIVGRIVFITDRSPALALPAVQSLGFDVKVEPLSVDSLARLGDLAPSMLFVDAVPDPGRAFDVMTRLARERPDAPTVVVVDQSGLEAFGWPQVADDVFLPESSSAELRVRIAVLVRRTGEAGDAVLRLGPLAMNVETYQVAVGGRVLDLTYKEFELLRFLVQHPGRVFMRSELLKEVWGYDFYGGTRTVDVHVRRLRAKLGAGHEGLISTVRGVGYRAVASAS